MSTLPLAYPMAATQRGVLFHSRSAAKTGLYHVQTVLEVAGAFDLDFFRRSWQHVAQRHAILRTTFPARPEQEPVQTVRPDPVVPLEYGDWRSSSPEEQAEALTALLHKDLEQGFSWSDAPLWRLEVARLTDTRHQILWSFHYILLDATSQATVLREVEKTYACLESGQAVDDTPAPSFSEYADWSQAQDLGAGESFWRNELRSVAPASPLPFENRPATNEGSAPAVYAQESLILTADETAALHAAGEQHEVTLDTVIRGVWATALSCYRGTDEVVLGVTSSGRSAELPGVQGIAGLLINTLPLRIPVPAAQPWAEFLRDLQERYELVQEHEFCPLVLIQQWSGIDSGAALFDHVLTIEQHHQDGGNPAEQGRFRMTRTWSEGRPAYPLSIVATPGESLEVSIHYDTERFSAASIARLAGHLRHVLAELVRRPDARLGELEVITTDESEQLIHQWNDTATPYSRDLCIQQLFERQVDRAPDALALLFEDERRTYRQVDDRANQVAHYLRKLGLGPGDHVAVLMERCTDMIPALLGVLKAGATYVPLDAGAPVKRWHWIIDALQITTVLTQDQLATQVLTAERPAVLAHAVTVNAVDDMPSTRPPREGRPEDLAYVIFTSGSTGTPKGVEVAHSPAVNLIEWVNTTFSIGPNDRMLFITALTFDLSVYDIFGILAAGGSIRIATGADIQEPANLLRRLADEPITFWDSAPAALMQLVPFLPPEPSVVSDSLRLIFMSGDWIPVQSPEVMKAAFPSVQVVGLGGATEATVWSNFFPIDSVDPAWSSIPYGKPIQNARYYVLDPSLRPCPVDVPGDLYIGGPCLSAGYAGDPLLTASKYIASPYGDSPGERIYRTGDMARWRPDGNLEFLGRLDSQVKIRGYRIELGEIDGVLSEHPVVQDSATIVRTDGTGSQSLVSFVVAHAQQARSAVEGSTDELADGRIEHWREVYDAFDPAPAARAEDGNDFSGWISSYTGQPIPRDRMQAWQQDSVALVREYAPRSILEIGCGTGLLLFPLAPQCDAYYGTDFSAAALQSVRSHLDSKPELGAKVVLARCEADDPDSMPEATVDTVVINSVIQYFPDADYLRRVLDGALARVSDGGRIIVGDVRSFALLEAFHADVVASRVPVTTTKQQLSQRVQRGLLHEEELTVAPAFFRDWATDSGRIARVEIRPRSTSDHTEMSRFRYQVVLHVGPAVTTTPVPAVDWGTDLASLREALGTERPGILRLENIPNARVAEAVQLLDWLRATTGPDTLEDWREQLEPATGIDPEKFLDLAAATGYDVHLDWGHHGPDGSYSAVLVRSGVEYLPGELATAQDTDRSLHANQPLKAEIQQLLIPQLQAYLAERLPGYMLPSELITLDALPVTSSGKLDRKALLQQTAPAPAEGAHRAPARNATEALLVSIWEQTLARTPIGVLDNFFDLGGHSLLAVQLVTRIRAVFGLEIPVRLLFDHPTIAQVAVELQQRQAASAPLDDRPLTPAPRAGLLPASFDQQRLFFIDRLRPGTTSYTVNWLIPLPAYVEAARVSAALHEMIRRHEPLRTTFSEADGQVWQVIAEQWRVDLPTADFSARTEEDVQAHIREWWDQPFDVLAGPLLRAKLLTLSETEQVVAFSAHHTIFDGYSIGLFGQEFLQICRALADDVPVNLPEPAVQYADYALWQQHWLEEDRLAFHVDYWKEQLADAPELLTLPTDFERPAEQTLRGDFLNRQLSPELTEQVAQLSRDNQVTSYITLLSSFAVFLSRYSGQDVVVIGVPIANRNRAELEPMIGFLVSTVALSIDLRDRPSFADVLRQVRRKLLDAQSHQEIPFERLVEALRPTRDLGYNPVFQVMFADESLPLLDHAAALAEAKPWMHRMVEQGMSVGVSRFDLTLMIQATPDGMRFGFEYSTDLFERQSVARMADHFEQLLHAVLTHPEERVERIPMISDAESRQTVEAAHGAGNEWALHPAPVHELFQAVAARCPDQVAAVLGSAELTYAALDRKANRLAQLLRRRGVGRESLVGLCLPRSLDQVVCQLAILKAGGAYVPIDPGYPADLIAAMVADATMAVVLTQRSTLDVLPETEAAVLALEDLRCELADCPDSAPEVASTGDDLAYVMYTSGSTGRPKGVAITHADVAGLALDSRFAQGHECVLLHSAQAFDASTYELWAPLLSGGRVVVAPPGPVTPELVRRLVAAHRLSAIWLTAALFHLFAQEDPGCLEGLSEVWTGGDVVQAEAVRQVRMACPRLVVVDGYGPTETTTFATTYRIEVGDELPSAIPIGTALDNMQTIVLDTGMRPVPPGVAGELYIGGTGLARGYLGRPDVTADVFVADPFRADGSRLYRTGDLARLRTDGAIELLGRADGQVKIRGFRVELGEIETALAQHPSVRDAAVLVRDDGPAKQLVAFVAGDNATDLRSYLGNRLPSYMIPSGFVPLGRLPLTPNGKVDRKALAALPWHDDTAAHQYVAPRSTVEKHLADIWRTVLRRSRPVSVHDSFFAIGGDSILSLQVTFRAKQLGLHLSVKQLFQHQTIAELAPHVNQDATPVLQADQGPVAGPVATTPIQRWFFDQTLAHAHHFNQSVLIDVTAELAPDQWQRVLQRLLEHHDVLRTRFDHDGTAEIVALPVELPWQVHDGGLGDIAAEAQSSFDLSAAPLVRAVLFSGLNKLLIIAHHLVVDVVSWHILLDDLQTLAEQTLAGQPLALPAKTTSWQHWAQRLHEAAVPAELPYWNEHTAPTRPLPLDGPGGADTVGRSRTYDAVLGVDETRAVLNDLPAVFNTQINDALLTAVATAVGERTKDSHIRIDLEGHGREDLFDDVDLSRTVGWFTTISPVRLPVPAAGDLGAGLKQIKELLRSRPRHGIGYGLVAHSPELATAPAPISFNYLGQFDNTPAGSFARSSGQAGPDQHPANQRPYPIEVVSHIRSGRLHMRWSYNPAAHTQKTIKQVAVQTLRVLEQLTKDTTTHGYSPSDLPLSGLAQSQLDALIDDARRHDAWRESSRHRPLADCYPQTLVQQGLLFQSQYAQGEGHYHVQLIFRIDQKLDVGRFRRAWSHVMQRHAILRTSFGQAAGSAPLQLVWHSLAVPLDVQDWRDRSADEQQHGLETYLAHDRSTGFAPDEAPQWRMLLARTDESGYHLVWSAHHAILDGWSISLLLNDAARFYADATDHEQRPTSYRDYVAWLQDQDLRQAETYWRKALDGLERPTLLSPTDIDGQPSQSKASYTFTSSRTTDLQAFAHQHQLTVNTVLQGAWALLLSRYTNSTDITFGTVTSGRPAQVDGIDSMIGLFINTLPLRTRTFHHTPAVNWLGELQEHNVQMRQYDYTPLNQIQRWTALPADAPLFDTLFVFENYPVDRDDGATLRFEMVDSEERINYPFALVVTIEETLRLTAQYDAARIDPESADRLLAQVDFICAQLIENPGIRLGEISVLTEAERRLEQLVAEVQGLSPDDLQRLLSNAATDADEVNHD
ncbi:amino acid adenylation domain-containing protein [Kribbella antibiotica]|uniref:Amino acid adenylation domain-containing protein n=1 Tax=Kribbella antibiotica TaxID=190195 RepID=A0A4R4Z7N4_9ACTN|nr:non-ribosomal peptide synthetase [Kribbella antibiotica]TDD54173.1 amino acid adenylation domain-containing protein [Kribbella antibiotica]